MKFLIFQHLACEHPGIFRHCMATAGVSQTVIALDEGNVIPSLNDFDALIVLGGPMNVWDDVQFPWLEEEKAAIRKWVSDLKRPYLGLCLGHQLLADALGGRCTWQDPPEIGVLDIALTSEAKRDPIFGHLPSRFKALQWHSVQIDVPPSGATQLASSEECKWQAMRVGDNAWSVQFHIEIEAETIRTWGGVDVHRQVLTAEKGEGALEALDKMGERHMKEMNANASTIFEHFVKAIRV